MPRIYRKRRKDANQAAIIAGLIAIGASVEDIDGKDRPDLLVGYNGRNELLEVKNVDGRNRTSEGQSTWHRKWRGRPPSVVRNLDEALQAIGALRHDDC